MNQQLLAKAKHLPAEVFAYLDSYKSDDLNLLIIEKYHLSLPQIKAYYDLVALLFLRELAVSALPLEIQKIFAMPEHIARQLACDIAGVRLLVVVDWLGVDVADLIKQWGGDPARYQTYVEVQREAIPKEAEWNAEQWAEPEDVAEILDDEETDWSKREKVIKELFVTQLTDTLSTDDDYLLKEINDACFYILANVNENFNEELSALLLANQERLTTQPIMVDGRQVEPTVANWLSDFLSQKGSDFFDAVDLSDFLVNAPNVQSLSPEDKERLTALLIVYRNLKFFPRALAGDQPSDWFIFPLSAEAEPETLMTPTAVKATAAAVPPRWQRQAAATVSASQSAPDEEILTKIGREDPRVKALEKEAAQYVEGSLERLALEEEIEKLKKSL